MQGILTLMQDWIDLKSSDYLIMRPSLWPSALWNMSVLKLAVRAKMNVSILPLSTRRMEVIKYIVWLYVFYGNRWDFCHLLVKQRGFTALHNVSVRLQSDWITACMENGM